MECIETFGQNFNEECATTAKRNLFGIKEGTKEMSENQKDIFHHIVAKLLFVIKRDLPFIGPTISFLCSRVD